LPWLLIVGAVAAAGACARHEAGADGDDKKAEAKQAPAFDIDHEADGTTVVVATAEACKAAGIESEVVRQRDVPSIALAHGVLREDPARVAVVRAPFGGTLAAGDVAWPELGGQVFRGSEAADAVLGRLLPRAQPLTPSERADLKVKLADATATKRAAEADLTAARAELARVKGLFADDHAASARAVETAEAAVAADEAKLRGADESIAIFGGILAAPLETLEPVALKLARGDAGASEVLFVGARIGESVEAGQELLRVADLHQLLASVTLPAGPDPGAAPTGLNRPAFSFASATVRADDGTSAPATILGPAPDSAALGRTFLLRVDVGERPLRPGQAVVAELARSGEPLHAIVVAESALVRYAGQSWVYVETEPGHFARARALIVRFVEGEAILTDAILHGNGAIKPDTKLVRVGAASLLSQEQLAAGGGGE
jgi:hypothetical protein